MELKVHCLSSSFKTYSSYKNIKAWKLPHWFSLWLCGLRCFPLCPFLGDKSLMQLVSGTLLELRIRSRNVLLPRRGHCVGPHRYLLCWRCSALGFAPDLGPLSVCYLVTQIVFAHSSYMWSCLWVFSSYPCSFNCKVSSGKSTVKYHQGNCSQQTILIPMYFATNTIKLFFTHICLLVCSFRLYLSLNNLHWNLGLLSLFVSWCRLRW